MASRKSKTEFRRLIETLSDTVQIDELAERLGINVKQSGGRAFAQCLFHNDTNPSMVLYRGTVRDKSHFHCYTCNEHGDIFDLVKKANGCDFQSAVNWLASTYALASTTVIHPLKPKLQAPYSLRLLRVGSFYDSFKLKLLLLHRKKSGHPTYYGSSKTPSKKLVQEQKYYR